MPTTENWQKLGVEDSTATGPLIGQPPLISWHSMWGSVQWIAGEASARDGCGAS
jgi:hypothetical protein